MLRVWIFFQNPFIHASRSFKTAYKISLYTHSQLETRQADAFFGPLFLVYDPLHTALANAYNSWKTQGGTQKGATLSVDQLLQLLSPGKINAWDYAVMGVCPKGTPAYVAIFPKGHKPFQTGEKDQRIAAVKQLANALAGIAPLAATLTDVQAFFTQLSNARSGQQGNIGNTGSGSDTVNDAVTAAMTGLYSILGSCITHFATEPTLAEPIFDMEIIRNHEQVIFSGTLAPQQYKLVVEHTFSGTDRIELHNQGSAILNFYLAANATDGPSGYNAVTLNPGENKTVLPTDIGPLANSFLHVYNTDVVSEGKYKVEL